MRSWVFAPFFEIGSEWELLLVVSVVLVVAWLILVPFRKSRMRGDASYRVAADPDEDGALNRLMTQMERMEKRLDNLETITGRAERTQPKGSA